MAATKSGSKKNKSTTASTKGAESSKNKSKSAATGSTPQKATQDKATAAAKVKASPARVKRAAKNVKYAGMSDEAILGTFDNYYDLAPSAD
jgi:hypothetical protein